MWFIQFLKYSTYLVIKYCPNSFIYNNHCAYDDLSHVYYFLKELYLHGMFKKRIFQIPEVEPPSEQEGNH